MATRLSSTTRWLRWLTPGLQIKRWLLLLMASELSSHITGQVLAVDGGVANQAALPVLKFGQGAKS